MSMFSWFTDRLPKKKTQEELDAHYDNIELEKGDFLAMIIAAAITFIPVVIVILVIIFGLMWLFLR